MQSLSWAFSWVCCYPASCLVLSFPLHTDDAILKFSCCLDVIRIQKIFLKLLKPCVPYYGEIHFYPSSSLYPFSSFLQKYPPDLRKHPPELRKYPPGLRVLKYYPFYRVIVILRICNLSLCHTITSLSSSYSIFLFSYF
jgi:hypothetical protein